MSNQAEWDKMSEDWSKIVKLHTSLERYSDMLAGRDAVDGAVAQAWSIGLESIDPDFDIKEGSAITLRAIKEGLVVAAKAARDLVRYLWELLNSFYVKFTGSIKRVRATQTGISRRLGKLGSKTTHTKMSVAGVQRLSIDGNFVGTDSAHLDDIQQLTNYILNVYPKMVTQIARDSSRQFLNILDRHESSNGVEFGTEVLSKFVEILERSFKAPQGAVALQARELATADKGVFRSEVLVGNVAFIYSPPGVVKQNILGTKAAVENIGQALTMQFAELQLNLADRSEREIEVPSVSTLSDLVTKISSILSLAEKAESGRQDFATVKTVVDDAIRQIADKHQGDDKSGNVILHVLGEISRKLAEPMGFYTHWLAVTLNVWLTFIGHCIEHYEREGV